MLSNENVKKYGCNKFRVNLHFDYSKGFVRHCCLHPWFVSEDIKLPSPLYKKIAADMLNGKPNKNCNFCYQREARGLTSLRLEHSNHLDGLEQLDPDAKELLPKIFEISISNICNLQCAYCRSEFSSVWEKEESKNNNTILSPNKNHRELETQREQFWSLFYSSPVEHVRIIGGEPFLNPEFHQILEKIIEHEQAENIIITVVSNLNFSDTYLDKFLKILPSITSKCEVRLLASMESTEETAEFIRYGLTWETYQKNFSKFYSLVLPKFTFGTRLTLNVLCARSLQSYLKYLVSLPRADVKKKLFECGNLVYPTFLQLNLLNEGNRHYLKDCFQYEPQLKEIFEEQSIKFFFESLTTLLAQPPAADVFELKKLEEFLAERKLNWGVDFLKIWPDFQQVIKG